VGNGARGRWVKCGNSKSLFMAKKPTLLVATVGFFIFGCPEMLDHIKVGILVSTTGSYGTVGRTIKNGVLIAVEELKNAGLHLECIAYDPQGNNSNYLKMAEQLLRSGIKNIIGCYTSSSRKKILPVLERYEGLLWYPTHYEGFENSENVIYTGTSPNHHIYPLIDFMQSTYGNNAFCVGSDYIWAWESNRVFKNMFMDKGGSIVGEDYLPMDCDRMDAVIEKILKIRPSFIFNTLVGGSSYHFFRKFRKACEKENIKQTEHMPIASCNLSEGDLYEIGEEAADGHYSSSVYFSSVDTVENKRFVSKYKNKFPDQCLPTVESEAAYIATRMLAAGIIQCAPEERQEIQEIKKAAASFRFRAPQGEVMLDPLNFHAFLTPRIGRSTKQGEFEIVKQSNTPIQPDPYLINNVNCLVHSRDRSEEVGTA